ncbi:hypothetical protein D3C80_534760 [compost metagenome]
MIPLLRQCCIQLKALLTVSRRQRDHRFVLPAIALGEAFGQFQPNAGKTYFVDERFQLGGEQPNLFIARPQAAGFIPDQPGSSGGLGDFSRVLGGKRREREFAQLIAWFRQRGHGVMFAQAGHEKAFAVVDLREHVEEAFSGQGLFGAWEQFAQWLDADRVAIGRQQPVDDLLIFLRVERAGGVDHDATRCQGMEGAVD